MVNRSYEGSSTANRLISDALDRRILWLHSDSCDFENTYMRPALVSFMTQTSELNREERGGMLVDPTILCQTATQPHKLLPSVSHGVMTQLAAVEAKPTCIETPAHRSEQLQ